MARAGPYPHPPCGHPRPGGEGWLAGTTVRTAAPGWRRRGARFGRRCAAGPGPGGVRTRGNGAGRADRVRGRAGGRRQPGLRAVVGRPSARRPGSVASRRVREWGRWAIARVQQHGSADGVQPGVAAGDGQRGERGTGQHLWVGLRFQALQALREGQIQGAQGATLVERSEQIRVVHGVGAPGANVLPCHTMLHSLVLACGASAPQH